MLQFFPMMQVTPLCRRFILLMMLACLPAAQAQEPQTNLPRVALAAGMHRIDAQVAATPSERQVGLMHRRSMPQHEGMLFVFERASTQCFWMKNTLLPLSAAFIDETGHIVNIADMTPLSTDNHCSSAPVKFVLEMNQGWFAKRKIGPGYQLSGPPFKTN